MKPVADRPAVGYIRVSTEGQATEGVSLDAQRNKIEAWAIANDHKLSGVFVDAGLSGGRADNRPELQKALDRVCEIKGALIVYSLSRLARSTRDTIEIADRLDKADADLVSLTEKIDTTSAAGKMLFRLLAVLAEFERDLISERTKGALQYMQSKLERTGTVPYGWRLADDGVHLLEIRSEQDAIVQMLVCRAKSMSFAKIAAWLNRVGIKSKSGGKWHPKVVRGVLERASRATNASNSGLVSGQSDTN